MMHQQLDHKYEPFYSEVNPWPSGYNHHGQLEIATIGINRSGIDAGNIDFCINTAAVERMIRNGRGKELIEITEAMLASFKRDYSEQ